MKESSAVIKLTKSEIEMVIKSLQFTEDSAEFFDAPTMFTHKIKQDFIQIKIDIIEGEKDRESKNKTQEENRNGPETCESCPD